MYSRVFDTDDATMATATAVLATMRRASKRQPPPHNPKPLMRLPLVGTVTVVICYASALSMALEPNPWDWTLGNPIRHHVRIKLDSEQASRTWLEPIFVEPISFGRQRIAATEKGP